MLRLRTTLAVAVCLIAALQFAPTASAVDLPSYITPASTQDPSNTTIQNFYPQYDESNPLRYLPNQALAIVVTALYALVGVALFVQLIMHGQKWMLTLIIGSFCYAVGMGLRLLFRKNSHSMGIYIALDMFTVLSPCAFLATDYVLLGRLVRHLGMGKHLLIKAQKTTIIFVGSDVLTFLVQAGGGGLASSKSSSTSNIGSKVFLVGIILQMISFILFTFLALDFGFKIYKHEPQLWSAPDKNTRRWKHLYYAMLWTCVGFIVRSTFRTAELSQGFIGRLSTTEGYVFVLDTLPLFLAIIAYIPFYPGRYLRPNVAGADQHAYDTVGSLQMMGDSSIEMESGNKSWYGHK
ncbi:RTA-like protein [Phaffia rhodozyma]|uniref:RTA-like protein n=1 Tax=Phaffia rhodozyma TaxID=264483 RepID=A0A0F7STQ4_PHARH|nr:RTA-like protein [Phaffia rhodozyma]